MLESLSPQERDDVIDIARRSGRIDRHSIISGLTQVFASSPTCVLDHLPAALTEIPARRDESDDDLLTSTLARMMSWHFAFRGGKPTGFDAVDIALVGKAISRLWLAHCKEQAESRADTFIEQWVGHAEVAA